MDTLFNIVIFLLILTGLVLLHELGHFVTARLGGVKVHEFGIGFPPRAKVLFRRGDTTYTLNWLPIGGFVRLEGETASPADGTESDEERAQREELDGLEEQESLDPSAFVNQGLAKRLVILVSGSVVNLIIAWLIFTFIAFAAQPVWKVQVASVSPDSPAETAGLVGGQFLEQREFEDRDEDGRLTGEVIEYDVYDETGDTIVAIDGQTFPVFDDMAQADAEGARAGPVQYLADRPEQTVTITVERADGTVEDVEATLRSAEDIEAGLGALGFQVQAYDYGEQQNGLVDAMVIGLERTIETSTLVLRAVGNIIVGLLSGSGDALGDVAGPVGMVDLVGEVRTLAPPVFMLFFVALISANLGVINLLPIPPLDGSRMAMGVVQALTGNRVSPKTERLVYFIGWVALMAFLIVVTFSDFQRLFG
jgi:regulator of sigma E protease